MSLDPSKPQQHSNVSLTDDDILRLARLAQIELGPEDRKLAVDDLKRIIEMVDAMRTIDTEGVEPLAHPLETTQRLREDVVAGAVDRDAYQAIAPLVEKGLYLVPRVIE